MSVRSVTDLAVKRDLAEPGAPVESRSPGRKYERTRDAIISAIPSEVLVLYTAVTSGTLALLIRDHPDSYLPYRWTLLAVVLLLIPTAVYVAYRRKFDARKKHPGLSSNLLANKPRVPYMEMASSTLAAAAWFLAAPGSPLLASMSVAAGEITSTTIVVAAAAILWVGFGRPLRVGSNLPVSVPSHIPAHADVGKKP